MDQELNYTSALVPSPFGSLDAASLTSVSMVTYGGRIEISSECSRALFRFVSLLKTPWKKKRKRLISKIHVEWSELGKEFPPIFSTLHPLESRGGGIILTVCY